jgi:hypothetical protein
MDQQTQEDQQTQDDLSAELVAIEIEIARQRLTREESTYRLEQLLRERDRLSRHLRVLASEDGVVA